jgi:hypothetical protein
MNLDEDKPIDVKVYVKIKQRYLIGALFASMFSILLTGFLLYFFASGLIPMISCVLIGITLLFFSLYFPIRSDQFFSVESEVIDIEEEELEELQSVMKPW